MTEIAKRGRGRGRVILGRVVLAVTVLFLAAAALVAVDLIRTEPTLRAGAPLRDQCDQAPPDAERLVLTAEDGFRLGGALVGPEDAKVGLVLRQGAGQTICEWLPLAGRIADEAGARVLLFDRRGQGSSRGVGDLTAEAGDTTRAAAWLRAHGTTRVGLIASSMGNSVVFSAVPGLAMKPCVVVAISPVLVSSDRNGTVDGTPLTGLPENVWVVSETGNAQVATYAKRIRKKTGTTHQLTINTQVHSIGLVRQFPEVADFVVEAASSCVST